MENAAATWLRWLLIALLLLNAAGAIYGGGAFIIEPSGKLLGISTAYLAPSPFQDYFWPGLILLLANGCLSLWGAWMGMRRQTRFPLWLVLQGCVSIGWIVVQVLMLQIIEGLHLYCLGLGFCFLLGGALLRPRPNAGSRMQS
jgi:hypothetical protein